LSFSRLLNLFLFFTGGVAWGSGAGAVTSAAIEKGF
jgi:hypothetical protein